jgi:hypothetical protein
MRNSVGAVTRKSSLIHPNPDKPELEIRSRFDQDGYLDELVEQ